MARHKKGHRSHRSKGLLGMGKKIPVAATAGAIVSVSEIYNGFQGNSFNGAMYHASGYDVATKSFHWQAAWNTWKPAVYGAGISYVASKVGASKITNKIPVIGKFLKV